MAARITGMGTDDQTRQLLTEIRDDQREGLALQKDAVKRQRQVFALYHWVVIGGAAIVAGLLVVLLVVVAFVVLMVTHLPSH